MNRTNNDNNYNKLNITHITNITNITNIKSTNLKKPCKSHSLNITIDSPNDRSFRNNKSNNSNIKVNQSNYKSKENENNDYINMIKKRIKEYKSKTKDLKLNSQLKVKTLVNMSIKVYNKPKIKIDIMEKPKIIMNNSNTKSRLNLKVDSNRIIKGTSSIRKPVENKNKVSSLPPNQIKKPVLNVSVSKNQKVNNITASKNKVKVINSKIIKSKNGSITKNIINDTINLNDTINIMTISKAILTEEPQTKSMIKFDLNKQKELIKSITPFLNYFDIIHIKNKIIFKEYIRVKSCENKEMFEERISKLNNTHQNNHLVLISKTSVKALEILKSNQHKVYFETLVDQTYEIIKDNEIVQVYRVFLIFLANSNEEVITDIQLSDKDVLLRLRDYYNKQSASYPIHEQIIKNFNSIQITFIKFYAVLKIVNKLNFTPSYFNKKSSTCGILVFLLKDVCDYYGIIYQQTKVDLIKALDLYSICLETFSIINKYINKYILNNICLVRI